MRTLAMLLNFVGLLACIATGSTGAYWGMGHAEIRELHLKFAVATVGISATAHVLAMIALKKPSK